MIIILMGVTGCGKTTVGQALAAAQGWAFYDGDDYHPAENVAKMRTGVPLTDDDRRPWLAVLRAILTRHLAADTSAVLACSALKAAYRAMLRTDAEEPIRFVYLHATPALIHARLRTRAHHFMPASLIASQFAALEAPADALTLDAALPVTALVEEIRRDLHLIS